MGGVVTTKDMKGYFGSDLDFCYHSTPFHINPLLNKRKLNLGKVKFFVLLLSV